MNEYPKGPLFSAFPGLAVRIPRIGLVRGPTPVSLFTFPFTSRAVRIKNDAFTASPYGGNKPRKLQFILADARRCGARSLLTSGGIGSNHCLATLIYGKRLGFEVHLLLFPQPVTDHVKMSLRLFHRYGARMYPGEDYARLDASVEAVRRETPNLYVIPPGGSSPVGVIGFVEAAFELAQQVAGGLLPAPRRIFIAAGTCGSLAGLAVGLKAAGLKTRVTGVQVVDEIITNPETVVELAGETVKLLRDADASFPRVHVTSRDFDIIGSYFGDGYGVPTAAGDRAMAMMKAHHGIDLEPTYTAKTFAAVLDELQRPESGEPLLYWHTFAGPVLKDDAAQTDVSDIPEPFQIFLDTSSAN